MSDDDTKLDHYYSLKPTDFSVLEKLELFQVVPPQQSPSDLSLKIAMRSHHTTDNRRLCLSFSGVVNLRLIPWSSFIQMPLLEIRSMRDRHWENLKYEVEEGDNNTLSFFCRDFEATLKDGE